MPEHYRSLIAILVLSTPIFIFTQKFTGTLISKTDFIFRRNIWFVLILAAFLSENFWLYAFITSFLLLFFARQEKNKVALYFTVLFILPVAYIPIPGMGLMNYLFELSHARLLALVLLIPASIALKRQGNTLAFGRTGPDKAILAFIILTSLLYLRGTTITDTLRFIFYRYLDIFLPYFVISRFHINMKLFRDSMASFVLATMLLAILGILEVTKGWLLYFNLYGVLGLDNVMGYLPRDGLIRAVVTAFAPIALGYLMVIGIAYYIFLQNSIQSKRTRLLGMLLLIGGLIAPLSRGPWVGTVLLLMVFVATGRYAMRRLIGLLLAGLLALFAVANLPGGERVINLLPFIGTTEVDNIEFRENLLTKSLIVIGRNPMLGDVNFLDTAEMQSLKQGGENGGIDIVNSYLRIALENGLITLGVFVGFFAMVVIGVYRAMRSLPDKDSDEYTLGRVLLSALLATLLIIFTMSSISIVPIVYWALAGLSVAYIQMVRTQRMNSGKKLVNQEP